MVLGFKKKTYNKLDRGTYKHVEKAIPTLPSALLQMARDTASESLKQTELSKPISRSSYTIRYNNRKFYSDSLTASLTTVKGKLVFPAANSPLIDKYKGQYTNAQLTIKERKIFLLVQDSRKRNVKVVNGYTVGKAGYDENGVWLI